MQTEFNLEGKPTQAGTLSDPYLRGISNLIPNTTNDDGNNKAACLLSYA
ncbi:hypothetical protein [uncultured Gammaproteobacteria bacterium]|nr:hypothetical protein [uncultured Gammaproteobacteria bacterium]CAC9548711.1 hypothetical protein [uncultured Gammaproteobacteria bacterium]CAC9616402.1 hypothetical protein [uncultured Gammaproteobacteria bacterium]CAC9963489.1 hypothetical protein [uncultured Gammaproteobacteria bacterium]CAC9971206.1 hypothetical protein [uncultured Gammaproteobacteria bacterium]